MNTSDEYVTHVRKLVDRWELERARTELEAVRQALPADVIEQLEHYLGNRETLAHQLLVVREQLDDSPQEATNQLLGLDAELHSHPDHASILKMAKKGAESSKRHEAWEFIELAQKQAAARLWDDADTELEKARRMYPQWPEDDEVRDQLEGAVQLIEDGRAVESLKRQLSLALESEKWTEADRLLAELTTQWNTPEEDLHDSREKLDKLRTRIQGRSTRQVYSSQVENLRAAQVSLELSKNWRGAFNNLFRLIEALTAEGREQEAQELATKQNEFIQNLNESIYSTIDARIESTQRAIKRGNLSTAWELVEAAETAGNPPEPAPGQPIDLAGPVEPSPEQAAAIAEIRATLQERAKARAEALEHRDLALQALSQRSLEAYQQALQQIHLIRGIDETFPGLDRLEEDVTDRLERALRAEENRLARGLSLAIDHGDIPEAQRLLGELEELGPSINGISTYEKTVTEAQQRAQRATQYRETFYAVFHTAQDNLDCSRETELRAALENWRGVSFDTFGPQSAAADLDRFVSDCDELARSHSALSHAIGHGQDLDSQVSSASYLGNSILNRRPRILALLAEYWLRRADLRDEGAVQVEYLRSAFRFAEGSLDTELQSRITQALQEVRARSKEGQQVAQAAAVLQQYVDNKELQSAIEYIDSLPADHPAHVDAETVLLISRSRRMEAQVRAQPLLEAATEAMGRRDWEAARDALHQIPPNAISLEKEILHTAVTQRLAWEATKRPVFEGALAVDISGENKTSLSTRERQALLTASLEAADIDEEKVSPSLYRLAKDVKEHYEQWESHVKAQIDRVEGEVHNQLDMMEFDQAMVELHELQRTGYPRSESSRISRLQRLISDTKRVATNVENRIQKARTCAAQGDFAQALRLLSSIRAGGLR